MHGKAQKDALFSVFGWLRDVVCLSSGAVLVKSANLEKNPRLLSLARLL